MDDQIINRKAFGRKLKHSRENLGYTQFHLSELVGISQNFLGDIERGLKLPSLTKLILLSNELKVSLDALFCDSLNNVISEPDEIYYTDRQLSIINSFIKKITDNF